MNLNYTGARKVIFDMGLLSLVSLAPVGIHYDVNEKLVSPRILDREELEAAAAFLDDDHMGMLDKIIRRETVESRTNLDEIDEESEYNSRCIQGLAEKNYVHRFEGKLYSSLSKESIEVIKTGKRVLSRDLTIAHIAHPILKYSIENEEEPDEELLDSPFMPKNCRRYIEKGYRAYKKYSRMPKDFVVPPLDPEDTTLKNEIVSAFLCQFESSSVFQYYTGAKRADRLISASDACTKAFRVAANEAAREILSLKLEKIKELSQLVRSYEPDNDYDDDYDDDELDDIDMITSILEDDDDDDDDDSLF